MYVSFNPLQLQEGSVAKSVCLCLHHLHFYNLSSINPLSTIPHQNVVWYNNSWLGFLKILNYVPKEKNFLQKM